MATAVTQAQAINVPGREEVKARARAILPLAREHAQEAERNRKCADEVIEAFRDAEIHRALQPRRFGGWELGFESLIDVSSTLSQGCTSTAWVCGLYMVHQWLATLFPEEFQEELWSAERMPTISGSYAPAAAAKAVDGGYRLSGRFSFSSGSPHADWNLCGAMIPSGAEGVMMPAFTIVPRSDYVIDWESWNTVGLSGTGSYDVLLDDAFIPAHRVLTFADAASGDAPGIGLHDNPIYRMPMLACVPYTLATPPVGAAMSALALFIEENRVRETRGAVVAGGKKVADFQTVQKRVGEVEALLDSCLAIAYRDIAEMQDEVVREGKNSLETRMRNRRSQAFIAHQAEVAMDTLFTSVGGRCMQNDHPIQRAWRDVHTANSHISLNFDAVMSMIGQHRFGLEPQGQY